MTTFTEWQRFFAWDSLADKAHVLRPKRKDSLSVEENRARQAWHDQRVVDRPGTLARELAAQVRAPHSASSMRKTMVSTLLPPYRSP